MALRFARPASERAVSGSAVVIATRYVDVAPRIYEKPLCANRSIRRRRSETLSIDERATTRKESRERGAGGTDGEWSWREGGGGGGLASSCNVHCEDPAEPSGRLGGCVATDRPVG